MISVDQLRRAGIGEAATRSRVNAGRLHRVHRGVYAVGHPALSPEGRWFAAVLALGGEPGRDGESVKVSVRTGDQIAAAGGAGAMSRYELRKAIRQANVLGLPIGLVVETDSYLYHRGRAAFQDDRERDLRLRRLGYDVL